MIIFRKARSAVIRLRQAAAAAAAAREERRRTRLVDEWLRQLARHPPEVLCGANFAAFGGVNGHLRAITRYSSCDVALFPPPDLMESCSMWDVTQTHAARIESAPLHGVRALHSHVFPWFVRFCRGRKGSIPWIHTYHLHYFPEHGLDGIEPWMAAINAGLDDDARHADVRLSVARWQVRWLRETRGIETIYLPNGVDVPACDAVRPAVDPDPPVLWVGRDDPVKNPVEFVRLAAAMPRCRFVMMGHELSPDRLAAAAAMDLPPNLLVRGGASHAEVQQALAGCAALVVTSHREGLPTLVLEAMAHRRQVVAGDEPGCREVLADGEFGFLYPIGDIGRMASAVESALARTAPAAAARQRVLDHYDWRVVAPALDRIYRGEVPHGNA